MNKLLTPKEVGQFLRLDLQTVRRKIKKGDIPAFKIPKNGQYRIDRDKLLDLIGYKNDKIN